MKLLTKEQQKSYENAKICYICEGNFEHKYANEKNSRKVTDHCHYTGEYRSTAHSIGENTVKHSLGENTEKYITFTVPIKKSSYKN